MPFAIGDKVWKHTGDYQIAGEVRATFTTKAGKVRYVVEHEAGFLHIYSDASLRLFDARTCTFCNVTVDSSQTAGWRDYRPVNLVTCPRCHAVKRPEILEMLGVEAHQ